MVRTDNSSPCRLSVFLARDAETAVVLRRGPSQWCQLVAWDRSRDTFTPGQWFHGRVYERRCEVPSATLAGKALEKRELVDLNPMRPEQVEPPAWARGW
jgi:hypothetical protein